MRIGLIFFYRGWFNHKVSTEAMMRGTANEKFVVSGLSRMPFVKAVFDVGMMSMKNARYLAGSSDGIALVDLQTLEELQLEEERGNDTEGAFIVSATIEFKTRVSAARLGESVAFSSALIRCEVGDDIFRKYVPKKHIAQVMHQIVVLGLRFAVYVAAAETGILYTVLIRSSETKRSTCRNALRDIACRVVAWAHEETDSFPDSVNSQQVGRKEIMRTRLNF